MKEFIPYNLAIKLKELGFEEECLGVYNTSKQLVHSEQIPYKAVRFLNRGKGTSACLAPLYQQAERFFRNKGFEFNILKGKNPENYYYEIGKFSHKYNPAKWYDTYELTEDACFEDMIEQLKNN